MLKSWSTRAINLPEHAHNPIHTDAGAQAAGYPSAIVAGVSIYAYLTHPPAEAWGSSWVQGGGGELRLKQPVLADDRVACDIEQSENVTTVVARSQGQTRATFEVWEEVAAPPMRDGDDVPALEFEITDDLASYGTRAGDDLGLYQSQNIAHPALWPNVANMVFTEHLVTGPWIHTRSRIFHQGVARAGDQLRVESSVIDRFSTRAGDRAVVDVQILANLKPVARLEHEALVSLKSG